MKTILLMVMASILWVQVPQWDDDWSKCAVDVPEDVAAIKKSTVLQVLNETN
jgi:hypothetical protein